MFNRQKVYPANDGSNKTPTSPLLNVDNVIESVTNEIENITNEAEQLVASQIPAAFNNKGGNIHSTNRNVTGKGAIVVGTKVTAKDSTKDGSTADDVEEIKLSHEIFHSEEKITEELSEHFKVLQKQIEEYRKLYQSAANKLKETQQKLASTEEKLSATEEEKLQIQEQLRNANRESVSANSVTVPSRVGKPRENNAEADAMQKRAEELRRALLFESEEEAVINLESILQSKNLWVAIHEYVASFDPFKRDLSLIQSRYGSSVASYFIFTRYLINQTVATATIALGFFIWHIFYLASDNLRFNGYFSAVGYLPYVMAYSSFSTDEGLLYDCFVLIVLIWTLTSILFKMVSEDKLVKTLGALDAENRNPYSKEVLAAWDFSRTTPTEVEEFSGSLGNRLLQQLEKTKTEGIQKARSRYELFFVYTRRTFGFLSFLITVVGSFTIILYVTIYGGNIAAFVARANIPGLTTSNVNTLIVPLILNIVNSALPTILVFITEKEKWDASSTETNLMMFRLYLASTLNGLLTVFSYLVLADPMLLAHDSSLRKSFGLEENTKNYSCRMDQVAEGLFTLVGFSWAIDEAMFFMKPIAKYWFARLRRKEYVKDEFDVADSMVKQMNFMGLVFASFPFCPMTLIFMPWFLIVGFKFEKNVMKYFYVKPKRPWQGQKTGLVYSSFYLISFVLVGLSVCAYFFSTKTFAKNCSIQDRFVHLCQDAVGSIGTNQCTMNANSEYYHFYRSAQYPRDICERSCGPFVDSASNLSPLHIWVTQRYPVKLLWDVILVYPYLPWSAVLVLAMMLVSVSNTLDVAKFSATSKERTLEAQLLSVEAEKKKQEKLLKKLQSIEATDEDGGGEGTGVDQTTSVGPPIASSVPFKNAT
jgi:hypothetical protein